MEINERNVGKLYRQFLALLGGTIAHTQDKLAATAIEHGGLIWAIDALQPEGHGTLLYVLYEVLSGTPGACNSVATGTGIRVTALPAAMRYILKAESYARRGERRKTVLHNRGKRCN
ncbi:MAG: hypothetical protein MET45_28950 [Nostoc sp. LLA-1]|nr:hypothetical protein [Cyanocohniella sp. LLY]